ncbi:hypothetical protein [Luteibacter sp. HA06]
MPTTPEIPSLFDWEMLDRMEQAVWATAFALETDSGDPAVKAIAADRAISALRSLAPARSRQPEPEYEAARIGLDIEEADFITWYRVECLLRTRGRGAPKSDEACHQAYARYATGRTDYW